MPPGFRVPETRQEADQRLERTRADVVAIARQLNDETRAKWYLETERTRDDYNKWREMAVRAKATKEKEQANLEAWIREDKRKRQTFLTDRIIGDPDSAEALLRAMYHVVRAATMEKRLTLDRDEAVAFAKTRDFLSESAFAPENGTVKDASRYTLIGEDVDSFFPRPKRRSMWAFLRGNNG
jgi:hypothetical protein